MRFTKMHGIGNDYVYVNGFDQAVDDPSAVARVVADRHFGVGGDGLILVLPSDKADVRMRMFNADGTESEMCGNGIRCVAKYAFDHGLTRANPMRVETGRGVLTLSLELGQDQRVSRATVDMGEPILDLDQIPVKQATVAHGPAFKKRAEHEYELSYEIDGQPVRATFVSMGNPHLVSFIPDLSKIALSTVGPALEKFIAFPRRINVHFVQVLSPGEIKMVTWERGSGITLACGTGACAVCVAGVLTDRTSRRILAHLPGGDLDLEWRESDGHVHMTGPATEVFSGEISLS
jgi:diaminopimelate epimerase